MLKPLFIFAAVILSAPLAAADSPPPPGATGDIKPVTQEDQDKLNKAIGNPQDAKVKIAPIGQSDKDNLNRAVNWIDKKLGPTGPPKKKASAAATAPTGK